MEHMKKAQIRHKNKKKDQMMKGHTIKREQHIASQRAYGTPRTTMMTEGGTHSECTN